MEEHRRKKKGTEGEKEMEKEKEKMIKVRRPKKIENSENGEEEKIEVLKRIAEALEGMLAGQQDNRGGRRIGGGTMGEEKEKESDIEMEKSDEEKDGDGEKDGEDEEEENDKDNGDGGDEDKMDDEPTATSAP